ncbi:unnamed protein product [Polarella glacialis]|uniref:Uncharacterized protein n=1 Tax=Polarella glacialis TaxID=89957 RepID=A0A813HSF0_POLGL|nr:unnamed protein product [Polarella glacialis]
MSSAWQSSAGCGGRQERFVILAVGTSAGNVQAWGITLAQAKKTPAVPPVSLSTQEIQTAVMGESDAPVTNLNLTVEDTPPSGQLRRELLVSCTNGVQVRAALFSCDASAGAVSVVQRFSAGPISHSLPIGALACDSSGMMTGSSSCIPEFRGRVRLVTLDSSGFAVFWRLAAEGELLPTRARSIAPTQRHHWLGRVEQAASCGEARLVRAAARERDIIMPGSTSYSGLALSACGCLCILQASAISDRTTTRQKPLTFLFSAPTGSPSQAFCALLFSACNALHDLRNSGGLFHLAMWDVAELWSSWGISRWPLGGGVQPSRQLPEPPSADEKADGKSILFLTLDWLQALFDKLSDAAPASLPSAFAGSSSLQADPAARAVGRGHVISRLEQEVKACSDPVAVCQLQNALLELGRRCTAAPGGHAREYRCFSSSEIRFSAGSLEVAGTQDYWQHRLQRDLDSPVAFGAASLRPPEAVLAHLAGTALPKEGKLPKGKKQSARLELSSVCRICKQKAQPDASLLSVSCDSHHSAPLCQKFLVPLVLEAHLLCGFCGRHTLALDGAKAKTPGRACAWCAAFVPSIVA